MPTVMTAAPTLGDLVKHDANPEYTREIVTLKSGQEYPAGAVLGKITASGHYTLAPATETAGLEGAEVACAVLLENVDATTAEADGLVLARGMSIVAENALTMDASVDTALERELKNQQLAAYGIVVRHGSEEASMSIVINPFGNGFSLAEMTQAINILPNQYGRLNQMGLFVSEPIAQRTVLIESVEGELRLLPATRPGAPATVGSNDLPQLRSYTVPHIPHNDVVLPEEVQGRRGFGIQDEDPLVTVMTRKLQKMRGKHAQTLEYMRVKALSGVTKDGAGNTVYDWHAEFGISKKSVDFKFGDAAADLADKCTAVARHIEENLKGETMTGIHAFVSPEFFDALIKHKSVKEAYQFQQGVNPLRDDVRRGFRFGSIVFEEYAGSVTLFGGSIDRLITAQEGIAFPLGTFDTFRTYFAPGNFMEAVGTYGQELYARQLARQNGTGIDILTESNPLPIVKRPALTVRLFSSNGW